MLPRFFVDLPLQPGADLALPDGPARHVQVLRLQPGAPLLLFNGSGGQWRARVARIGRRDVEVIVEEAAAQSDCELATRVTLALGMPANERMDAVVEKATELGVFALQPLICERSVLRLTGERADKKVAHWQAVAVAACEQSGRTRLPAIRPVATLRDWLQSPAIEVDANRHRWLLSLGDVAPVAAQTATAGAVVCLSGPEGGLTEAEEASALGRGFVPVSLGQRVLRADTAPLAVLSYLALAYPGTRT